jgi:hypothetical protein
MERSKSSFPGRLLVLVLALALSGCDCHKRGEWTKPPEGFVKVAAGGFEWKAVAPDGSAIGVRYRQNGEEGSLAFWTEVFQLELVQAKGYRLGETTDVQSADGVPGKLLTFEFAQSDTPYHYGLAVFATKKSIVTVETATELRQLPRYAPAFEAARRELRVKNAE